MSKGAIMENPEGRRKNDEEGRGRKGGLVRKRKECRLGMEQKGWEGQDNMKERRKERDRRRTRGSEEGEEAMEGGAGEER